MFIILMTIHLCPVHAADFNISGIQKKLEQHQENFPKVDIKEIENVKMLIDYMYDYDQELRKLVIKHQHNVSLLDLLKKLDKFHTNRMKEILKVHGWIVISKFGLEYDRKAWILVQHADGDPFFQAGILFVLEKLANQGETDIKNVAYLYDRVALKFNNVGVLQKYGTQVDILDDGNAIKLQPYEGNLQDIEKRRQEAGLTPLNDYFQQIKKVYGMK